MALENTKYKEVIHKKLKKCEYCGRELTPIGLDYLYANFSPDNIEYERCICKKAQEYWKEKDKNTKDSKCCKMLTGIKTSNQCNLHTLDILALLGVTTNSYGMSVRI